MVLFNWNLSENFPVPRWASSTLIPAQKKYLTTSLLYVTTPLNVPIRLKSVLKSCVDVTRSNVRRSRPWTKSIGNSARYDSPVSGKRLQQCGVYSARRWRRNVIYPRVKASIHVWVCVCMCVFFGAGVRVCGWTRERKRAAGTAGKGRTSNPDGHSLFRMYRKQLNSDANGREWLAENIII